METLNATFDELEHGPSISYDLLTQDRIEAMRAGQAQYIVDAGNNAIQSLNHQGIRDYDPFAVRGKAEQAALGELKDRLKIYVDNHIPANEYPEQYGKVYALLSKVSTPNMFEDEWRDGVKQADGSYDATTSGRAQARDLLEALGEPPRATTPKPATQPAQSVTKQPSTPKPIKPKSPRTSRIQPTPLVSRVKPKVESPKPASVTQGASEAKTKVLPRLNAQTQTPEQTKVLPRQPLAAETKVLPRPTPEHKTTVLPAATVSQKPNTVPHDTAEDDTIEIPRVIDADPVNHFSPEAQAVYSAQSATREALARLSVERRRMMRQKGEVATDLAEKYRIAKQAYEAASLATFNFYITHYREANYSDRAIRAKVIDAGAIREHHAFAKAELAALATDDSLRARAARFFGKRGTLMTASAGTGLAIGVGGRAASKTALAASIGLGLTAPAGLIAFYGIKTTKNVLTAKVRNDAALNKQFNKRHQADTAKLHEIIGSQSKAMEMTAATQKAIIALTNTITERVELDRKSNVRRVATAAIVGDTLAVAGIFGPDIYHHFVGHHSGTHRASSAASTHHPDRTSQGHTSHHSTSGTTITSPDTTGTTTTPTTDSLVDGFNPHVNVKAGNGYIHEFQDLAAQKGQHLSLDQATNLYHEMLQNQGAANFFEGNDNYVVNGANYISRAGASTWTHATLAHFNTILQHHIENGEYATTA